jgi:2-polyprenyl-3-methyl-5-hydroxy-6-metoxy-1,4-benzoquinol methylase
VQAAPDTLERLVPDQLDPADGSGQAALALHLERYAFAARHLPPGRWLDMACGVGYGSARLASEGGAREVVGVDLSEQAVAYARSRYAAPGLRFARADAMRFREGAPYDGVVSLETIEHVPDPAGLVAHLVSLLRPGGVLVASVPTTPSVDVNPHHLHDFTERSFRRMLAAHGGEEIAALRQVQRLQLGAMRGDSRFRRENLRPGLPGWYARHPLALLRRVAATLRFGLANHYLSVAWRRRG